MKTTKPCIGSTNPAARPRRKARFVFRVLGAAVLVLALAFCVLQTPWAKRKLADTIAQRLSAGSSAHVALGAISGFVPFTWQIDRADFHDASGTWLSLRGIEAAWSPWPLFERRIYFPAVAVREISLSRMPAARDSNRTDGPFSVERLADALVRLPALRIDRFAIDRFTVGAALGRQEAAFSVVGQFDTQQKRTVSLRVERVSGPRTLLAVDAAVAGSPLALSIDARLEDGAGGFLGTLLGVREGTAAVALAGAGPVADWHGALRGTAWGLGSVDAELALAAAGNGANIDVKGSAALDPGLLPERYAPLLAGTSEAALSARYEQGGPLEIRSFALRGGLGELRGAGHVDLAGHALDLACAWKQPDLAQLASVARVALNGAVTAEGRLTGAWRQPAVVGTFEVSDFRAGPFRAAQVSAGFDAALGVVLAGERRGVRISGNGSVGQLVLENVEQLSGFDWQWNGSIAVQPGTPVAIETLTLENPSGRVHLAGRIGPYGTDRTLALDADVAQPYAFLSLPGRWRSLLEARGTLQGTLAFPEQSLLLFQDFQIASAGGWRVAFSGERRQGKLQLQWDAAVPELAKPAAALRVTANGAWQAAGELSGAAGVFAAAFRAEGNGVMVGGCSVPHVTADVRAEGLPGPPSGELRLAFPLDERTVTAAARFALSAEAAAFTDVTVEGPPGTAAGAVTLRFAPFGVDGTVRFRADDLSKAGVLGGMDFSGSVAGEARFASTPAGQAVDADATLEAFACPFGLIGQGELHAEAADVLRRASVRLSGHAAECVTRGIALETLEVSASGKLDALEFSAKARGLPSEPFEVETAGAFFSTAGSWRVTLERLRGTYREFPFALEGPAVLTRNAAAYSLESIAATIGGGRIEGSGGIDGTNVDATVSWRDVSLDAARVVGLEGIEGTLEGSLRVTKEVARPDIALSVRGKNLALSGRPDGQIPPMGLAFDAGLKDGMCQTSAELSGLFAEPVRARASFPAMVSLVPPGLSVPENAALDAAIEAHTTLGALGALLLLDDQHAEGSLDAALEIGGTLGAPSVSGRAVVENGSYEHLRMGTVLRDISLLLEAKGSKLELVRAIASDGGAGKISATGSIEVNPAKAFPARVTVTLDNVTLVRRDDAAASLSGALVLTGGIDAATLSGKLEVVSADVRIPDSMAQEAPALDVVEINAPDSAPPAPEKTVSPVAAFLERIGMNVALEVPGRALVRARNLDSQWSGALTIRGSAARPEFSGAFSSTEGHLFFLEHRFVLTHGAIAFDGKYPPSPSLDLTLETNAKDLAARLGIQGPIMAPEVTLTSEPPLPQDEILSRLVFGRGLSEISPMRAIELAQSAAALSGTGGIFGFAGRTQHKLGIRGFSFTRTAKGKKESTVQVGKYLGGKLYVEVEKDIGESGGKVSVETGVTRDLTIKSDVGTNASGGLWLQWERDY